MNSFEFFSVPRIIFSRGSFSRIGELASGLGSIALIVFNGPREPCDRAHALLRAAGVAAYPFRLSGEPKVNDVEAALELARSAGCDMAIGLGGGSAIDLAKAVAGLLTNGGGVLDYLEVIGRGKKFARQAAPWIAIPTTAGTGAEVTRNAVIGAPDQKFKASLRGEQLLARIALVDPELHLTTPAAVTASSGMDALCQCIESYTSTGAGPITDVLAIKGMGLAARAIRRAFTDGTDIAAREEMALAALLSGQTLSSAGLGAVHGFAAPIGANFPIPHGTVCAALLPFVIAANVAALREASATSPAARSALSRYATVGRTLMADPHLPGDAAMDAAITFCRDLSRDLLVPRLGALGMAASDVQPMVVLARKASSMKFNPVVLSDAALSQVLQSAL